jgi:hypothetical protein
MTNLDRYTIMGYIVLIVGLVLMSTIIALGIFELTEQTVLGLPNPYFSETLALPILISGMLFSAIGLGLTWASGSALLSNRKKNKYAKCFSCTRTLSPNIQQVKLAKNTTEGNEEQIQLCRDCILKELERQDGLCPQCKQPIKWNGNLKEFLGEWYHPRCFFELQQGNLTRELKEVTRQVIVKYRCPYCKYVYEETLDKCPQCGGKH